MTANKKIKQRKCPFGKIELCDCYGNCGDCTWHKVIEKYEKKIGNSQRVHRKVRKLSWHFCKKSNPAW